MDVIAFEQMGSYQGTYHILHGVLSPIDGIGPEQLRLQELFSRIHAMEHGEVIIATNPNLEGEATAQYIRDHMQNPGVTVTRIAKGLPMGGDLEYADSTTLKQSLMGRVRL
jgi:recombination protein RecR